MIDEHGHLRLYRVADSFHEEFVDPFHVSLANVPPFNSFHRVQLAVT
jgi:hypothetical protein